MFKFAKNIPSGDKIALFTWKEYYTLLNPKGKFHSTTSYDQDLQDLNRIPNYRQIYKLPRSSRYRGILVLYSWGSGHVIYNEDKTIVAVIHNKVLYTTKGYQRVFEPAMYLTPDYNASYFDLPDPVEYQRVIVVKYPHEMLVKLDNVSVRNKSEYPKVLKNLRVKGELFELRTVNNYVQNSGDPIVFLNTKGQIVATAEDTWGATLLIVAQEYRRLGLGSVLGKVWYEYNPSYSSGGFTNQGLNLRFAIWQKAVRDFMASGGYSKLLSAKKITAERIQEILGGLKERPKSRSLFEYPDPNTEESQLLVYNDATTFILYDSKFLDDPDEDYILGYGFLRDSPGIGSFYYSLDYERSHAKLTTGIALQMARNQGEDLYIGEGYGDLIEYDLIASHVVVDGDYIRLTKDLVDLRQFSRIEKALRKVKDPYDEAYVLLFEMAESKFS